MAVILAYAFDENGVGRPVDVEGQTCADLQAMDASFVWVGLLRADPDVRDWLTDAGLSQIVMHALNAVETRPRCTVHDDEVLMNLRGVNLAAGAEPEDMVSIRMWITEKLIITVQRRPLSALLGVTQAFEHGKGPTDVGDLVARLALRLADRAEPEVADLNERIDDLEDDMSESDKTGIRAELADIRRTSIMMRRFMFPQRDALNTLEIEDMSWLTQSSRSHLREASERVTRLAEDLDAIRDRANVVHDQIMDMRAETMNRQMLVLSVVTAVFLPLGLLTGLLGINVAGIPGAGNPWAFWVVCAILVVAGGGQVLLFRRIGLLKD